MNSHNVAVAVTDIYKVTRYSKKKQFIKEEVVITETLKRWIAIFKVNVVLVVSLEHLYYIYLVFDAPIEKKRRCTYMVYRLYRHL